MAIIVTSGLIMIDNDGNCGGDVIVVIIGS